MYLDSPKWEWSAMAVSVPATAYTAVSPRSRIGFFSWPREPRIATVIPNFQFKKVTCNIPNFPYIYLIIRTPDNGRLQF